MNVEIPITDVTGKTTYSILKLAKCVKVPL